MVKMLAAAPAAAPGVSRPVSAAGGGGAGPARGATGATSAGGADGGVGVAHALRAQLEAAKGTLSLVSSALSDDFDTADEAHAMVARVRKMMTKQQTEEGWRGD